MELQKLNTKWKGKNNMALELVTGYKGQNHVTADQWADFNRSIYGTAAILPVGNKMAVEIQTANQITVKDGVAVFDGRQIYIGYGESENVAIESGTQAMLRNDIVVVKYTKNEETGVESVAFEVITGVPAASDPVDPSYQDMDIRTGVFTSQKAFCRVHLNGVAIEGIDMLVDVKEINDHAFAAPANNLTTATPGTALDAAMGKKLQEEYDQLNGDIASLTEKKAEIIQKVYTNITSDQYGFFSIAKLNTDFPNGFKIISAYGKDGGISGEGNSVLPVFSIDKTNKTKNYGYVYRASGAAMTPVGGAKNMTFLVTLLV